MTATLPAPVDLAMPPRGGLILNVLEGLHRGVALPISGESCVIGSATDCDVVLADRQIAPDHLRLRFYGRQVAIDALGGNVQIEGRAPVERGHGCRMTLPVTLRLGEARLLVGRDTAASTLPARRVIVGLASLLVAVVVALLATQSSGFGVAVPPVPQPARVAAAPAPVDGGEAVTLLQDRVTQAGLDGLTVTGTGNHVVVTGSIAEAQRPAWTEVQRWFDGTFGGRHVLSGTVVTAAAATPPAFAFQAVWFGANPYVVDARGERRYPGAALQGGWMLKSIDEGGITVTRNGTDFTLTL